MFLRRAITSAIVVLIGISFHARSSVAASGAQEPTKIQVTAKRFTFSPSELNLKKGEPVVLVLRSEDVTHGLAIKEFNLNTDIPKDTATELSFTPTEIGDIVGHCSHFCGAGHGEMALTLHVTE